MPTRAEDFSALARVTTLASSEYARFSGPFSGLSVRAVERLQVFLQDVVFPHDVIQRLQRIDARSGAPEPTRVLEGSGDHRPTPGQVSGITTATSLVGGAHHACSQLQDLSVRCWGWNRDGLGDNATGTRFTPAPFQL